MSEIKRYMYARDGMVPDAEHLRGSGEPEFWVRFTDHEAERAENLATIDFLNKELRSAVDALADAKARIEDLHYGDDNLLIGTGYQLAVNDCLAALTQPQTEKCPQCGGDGKGPLTHHFGEPCPTCDGGGAATAAEETVTVELSRELIERWDQGTLDAVTMEDYNARLDEIASAEHEIKTKLLAAIEAPGPYAKAFREKFPVPEFPGIEKEES